MAMIKKSITVTTVQEKWIQAEIANGKYGTDSELIRDALREKQNRELDNAAIRAKLIRAEQSGLSSRTPDQIRQDVRSRLQHGK